MIQRKILRIFVTEPMMTKISWKICTYCVTDTLTAIIEYGLFDVNFFVLFLRDKF